MKRKQINLEAVEQATKVRHSITFIGMLVIVVEARSKCCCTKTFSFVAKCRPARTLCTSLVKTGES